MSTPPGEMGHLVHLAVHVGESVFDDEKRQWEARDTPKPPYGYWPNKDVGAERVKEHELSVDASGDSMRRTAFSVPPGWYRVKQEREPLHLPGMARRPGGAKFVQVDSSGLDMLLEDAYPRDGTLVVTRHFMEDFLKRYAAPRLEDHLVNVRRLTPKWRGKGTSGLAECSFDYAGSLARAPDRRVYARFLHYSRRFVTVRSMSNPSSSLVIWIESSTKHRFDQSRWAMLLEGIVAAYARSER